MFNNYELTQEMPKLEKFAMRLTRNRHDMEDLLQSTLLRAIEKKHLFEQDTDLFKWTSKIMYNLFVSSYRRKVKFETQYDPEGYIEKQSVESSQDNQVELMEVNNAMNLLSRDHRKVLVFICVRGMSYQDVSSTLDIPVGTVRSRLSRAREQLQENLAMPREVLPLPPAANRASFMMSAAA